MATLTGSVAASPSVVSDAMATRARPLLLCLCLCFASSCLSSAVDAAAAAGNGYRTTAFLVDDEGRRLRAELVAGGGGGNTAYGGDVQRLDVYARCARPLLSFFFLPQIVLVFLFLAELLCKVGENNSVDSYRFFTFLARIAKYYQSVLKGLTVRIDSY